ncbi:MAG: YigZ family protein [Chitinophagaceae bacterium]|nr:YigZ family protein [Chitinophagaceae bacterium]MCW5905837.1 YigZ family protein [Chitinophagaceae bacterium]
MNKEQDYYLTIAQNSKAEFKEKGSRFIAYTFPITTAEDVKTHIASLKKEHPKASHHCFAYRLGLDGNNFRANDDGEPSGTAGKPILGQIDSKKLTNTLVVVVRYFGGTLLGVSGLINAYKTTTALALQTTPIIQKAVEIVHEFQYDYTKMNPIMTIVKQYNCTIIKQEHQLFYLLTIGIPKARLNEVLYKITEVIEGK